MLSNYLLDRKIALVTCMDPRIRLSSSPNVPAEAFVLRNAGGRVTPDVIRGLILATRVIGLTEIGVLHHDDCRLHGPTNEELAIRTGVAIDFLPFPNLADSVQADVESLRACGHFGTEITIWGGLYDVQSHVLQLVSP